MTIYTNITLPARPVTASQNVKIPTFTLAALKVALGVEVRSGGQMMLTSRAKSGGSPKARVEKYLGMKFRTREDALAACEALSSAVAWVIGMFTSDDPDYADADSVLMEIPTPRGGARVWFYRPDSMKRTPVKETCADCGGSGKDTWSGSRENPDGFCNACGGNGWVN